MLVRRRDSDTLSNTMRLHRGDVNKLPCRAVNGRCELVDIHMTGLMATYACLYVYPIRQVKLCGFAGYEVYFIFRSRWVS